MSFKTTSKIALGILVLALVVISIKTDREKGEISKELVSAKDGTKRAILEIDTLNHVKDSLSRKIDTCNTTIEELSNTVDENNKTISTQRISISKLNKENVNLIARVNQKDIIIGNQDAHIQRLENDFQEVSKEQASTLSTLHKRDFEILEMKEERNVILEDNKRLVKQSTALTAEILSKAQKINAKNQKLAELSYVFLVNISNDQDVDVLLRKVKPYVSKKLTRSQVDKLYRTPAYEKLREVAYSKFLSLEGLYLFALSNRNNPSQIDKRLLKKQLINIRDGALKSFLIALGEKELSEKQINRILHKVNQSIVL